MLNDFINNLYPIWDEWIIAFLFLSIETLKSFNGIIFGWLWPCIICAMLKVLKLIGRILWFRGVALFPDKFYVFAAMYTGHCCHFSSTFFFSNSRPMYPACDTTKAKTENGKNEMKTILPFNWDYRYRTMGLWLIILFRREK